MDEPSEPTQHLSQKLSGALRQFAYWIANGTVGLPLLDGIDYWDAMRESPSLLEQTVAIFANMLELDANGTPVNAKAAEHRAAEWIRRYMTGEPPAIPWGDEVNLY